MTTDGLQSDATSRVVIRAIVYYAVLVGGIALAWKLLPRAGAFAPSSLDALFGNASQPTKTSAATPLDEVTLAITVGVDQFVGAWRVGLDCEVVKRAAALRVGDP